MNQNYSTPFNGGVNPMGLGVQQQPMLMYNQQQMKQPEYTNPLGNAKIKELLEKGTGAPSISISEEDYTRAICTHRYNGQMRLYDMQDGSGKHKCEICGAEFQVTEEAEMKDVAQATDILVSILHTAKMAWLDMPDKTGSEFFQAIAVIEKTPELFKIAMGNYASHTNTNYNLQNTNNPIGGFNMYQQIMGPGMQPQPYNNMGYQQPQVPQYYDPNQQYQQQAQMYNNPAAGGYYNNSAANQMQAAAPGLTNPGLGYYTTGANNGGGQQQQNQQQQGSQQQAKEPSNKGEKVTKQLQTGL